MTTRRPDPAPWPDGARGDPRLSPAGATIRDHHGRGSKYTGGSPSSWGPWVIERKP